ncbi:MAG: metallophosphoesterase [Ghiorsea sp.]
MPIVLRLAEMEGGLDHVVAWFSYLNMGFFSLLFLWYLLSDVLHLLVKGCKRWVLPLFQSEKGKVGNPDRRQFMSNSLNLGLVGVSSSMVGVGFAQAVGGAVVREVNVPLGHVPIPLKDIRIAQFTDLHIGPMIKRDYVEGIVSQINQLKPDIIVMTGDLVDGSVAHLKDDVAPLETLSARYGKYFVTGNHEYYSGAEAWIAEMERLGFKVLLNEHQLIEHKGAKLLLAGVTDYRAHTVIASHQSDPAKAMKGAPKSDVKILLAHQPKSIYAATDAGFDLQISGHTHGGQYYPMNFIAKMVNPYIKGLHLHKNKTWIYVSPGTGYWGPPMRLGTEAEITLFRLS